VRRAQGDGGAGELVGGMAHVHAGVVQHQIADIDELPVEDERPHRLGQVAARLPSGRQAGALKTSIETQDCNRHLLEPSGDPLPWQVRQVIDLRNQRLRIEVQPPAPEHPACPHS
jgi:hypothetical protein